MNKHVVRQQMIDLIRLRHMSYRTERSYLGWFDRYCRFLERTPAVGTSTEKVRAFLDSLVKNDVSASTQNQAFNALIFLYRETLKQPLENVDAMRALRGERVRHAVSIDEVRTLLATVQDRNGYPIRLIVQLLYGCGLRVNEPLELRIKDLKLAESKIIIRQAKGNKDRVVALPCSLVEPIRRQIDRARLLWENDQAARVPVKLPDALARKYPAHEMSWSWYWLFPLHRPSQDPRSDKVVRWHCLDTTVQRSVREAVRSAGLDCMITPHVLRHCYATHVLDRGANPRAVQQAMGHTSLETTMGYMHAESTSVKSPLDLLAGRQLNPLDTTEKVAHL